jgi:hexokinase
MGSSSPSTSPIKAPGPPKNPATSSPASRDKQQTLLSTHTVVTVLVLLLALSTGFFAPHLPHAVVRLVSRNQAPGIALRNPIVLQEPPTCPKSEQEVEFIGTFNTEHGRSMALAEQAKRVAAEFDFGDDAVNKAVKEFRREMGMCRSVI